jgi:YgiT-type zinc finger domain-containing protein
VVGENACLACQRGTLARGTTTATFDAEGTTVVIRNVPADVCDACGQGYFDPLTSERLLELAAAAAGWSGAPVQICDYE